MVATPEHTSPDDGDFSGYVELACRIRVIKDHHTVQHWLAQNNWLFGVGFAMVFTGRLWRWIMTGYFFLDICLLSSEEWDGKALDMTTDLFPYGL